MHRILILPIAAGLLTLTACTPGTYVPSRGYFYPTPHNEKVQPWQRPVVRPLPPPQRSSKHTAPKPEKPNPGRAMM